MFSACLSFTTTGVTDRLLGVAQLTRRPLAPVFRFA